jgi:uncharacterized protein YaaQ
VKLLLTIVQDADAAGLQDALAKQGLQSTKLASTGGFLREGNTTLLIGVDDDDVGRVTTVIHDTCRQRSKVVSAGSPIHALEGVFASQPMQVPVGGAIVFVLAVESFVRV